MSPKQLDLFGDARARHDDPDTSRDAAAKVNKGRRLERIAEIVGDAGVWGAIADEVWQRLILDDSLYWTPRRSTVHGAVSGAAKAGLIVPRGDGARRLSVLNSVQTVYVTSENQRGK